MATDAAGWVAVTVDGDEVNGVAVVAPPLHEGTTRPRTAAIATEDVAFMFPPRGYDTRRVVHGPASVLHRRLGPSRLSMQPVAAAPSLCYPPQNLRQ